MLFRIRYTQVPRLIILALAAAGLSAQQAPPKTPPDDDVTAYLNERRAPALRRMADDDLIRAANQNLAAGNYSDAEKTFRDMMEREPETTRGIDGIVRVYLAQNRTDDAIRFLQSEVKRRPGRLDVADLLTQTARRVGDYDLEIAGLIKSLHFQKDGAGIANVYSELGEAYLQKGDLNSSIAALQKAMELQPHNLHLALSLARAHREAGEAALAAEEYRAALGADSTDGPALFARATALVNDNGDLDVALECAQLAQALLPRDPAVDELLGRVFQKKGLVQQAIPVFQRLVAREPQVYTHHFYLGLAFLGKGDDSAGVKELQAALDCNPPEDVRQSIRNALDIFTRKQ